MESIENIIIAIAPQFNSNTNKSIIINIATNLVSTSIFGDNYNYAVALRACHILTLAARNSGDAGSISSKSENGSSISYGGSFSGDDLESTWYGRQFKQLTRSTGTIVSIANLSESELL